MQFKSLAELIAAVRKPGKVYVFTIVNEDEALYVEAKKDSILRGLQKIQSSKYPSKRPLKATQESDGIYIG